MSYAPDRRFAWICALSLVLHGLIFAALSWQRQARPLLPPTLIATLRQAISPAPAPHAGPAVAPPRPAASAAVPEKARPSPAFAAPPLAPRLNGTAEPTMAAPAVEAEAPAAHAPAVAAPATPAPAAASAAPSAGDALAAYRQRLAALLAGQQEYPRVAALRGWEGEVRLRLRVARKGNLLGIELDHSSGFAVLDQHAVAMLEALSSLPPLPEALGVAEIQMVVPINYKLKKST